MPDLERIGNAVGRRPMAVAVVAIIIAVSPWVLYDLYPLMRDRSALQARARMCIKPGDDWNSASARLRAAGFRTYAHYFPEYPDGSAIVYIRHSRIVFEYNMMIYKWGIDSYYANWDPILVAADLDSSLSLVLRVRNMN